VVGSLLVSHTSFLFSSSCLPFVPRESRIRKPVAYPLKFLPRSKLKRFCLHFVTLLFLFILVTENKMSHDHHDHHNMGHDGHDMGAHGASMETTTMHDHAAMSTGHNHGGSDGGMMMQVFLNLFKFNIFSRNLHFFFIADVL
jgi:hypothetical protein